MTADTSPIVPDYADVPEDDAAEPDHANIEHAASVVDVEVMLGVAESATPGEPYDHAAASGADPQDGLDIGAGEP